MERTEVLDMMSGLKLYGMRSAYDETLATVLKRKHEPQRFVGDLLKAEISEKQARSIKYQLTVAKLPLAKDVDDFAFKYTPIKIALVRDLPGGRTRQFSLRSEMVPEVRRWLANYQELKEAIEAICEINHELLRPEAKAVQSRRKRRD